MRRAIARVVIAALAALCGGPAFAQLQSDAVRPEAATGSEEKRLVTATRHMVAAANPIAVETGLEILRNGGNAADALVAVQAMLGLVEPQSSGIGGGAFLVWYDGKSGSLTTFDGRETAPAAAGPDLFLGEDGSPLGFFEAVVGGRSVGVPGVPRLLETVHGRYGSKAWADLFSPAEGLAEKGFAISPRLAGLIAFDAGRLAGDGQARAYFLANGQARPEGAVLKNPDYAKTLRMIAERGADAFYGPDFATKIVEAVASHPTNPGRLAVGDFAAYEVKERTALCAPYRGYEVCGMGPPSSGALTVGQILGMLEGFDLAALGPDDPESWRILGEATRLAFADRERYMADADFVDIPEGLLEPDYLETRAKLIRRPTALGDDDVTAGSPRWKKAELRLDGLSLEQPATTHVVIADAAGNVASMTSTIESAFGARLMVEGFLLNNELTDFSFLPEADGEAVANRVEPGKRPRSSMAPTIVLKDGKPVFALGSPGGSSIIPYVAKTLVALIDWDMDMQAAIALPHLVNRFGPYEIESGTPAEDMVEDLEAFGFETKITDLNSGLHGIAFTANGLEGGADPRREGIAAGD